MARPTKKKVPVRYLWNRHELKCLKRDPDVHATEKPPGLVILVGVFVFSPRALLKLGSTTRYSKSIGARTSDTESLEFVGG
ncbi:hypothetical protein P692DRAFT_20828921 [Suillus brevipes Sb2]|nr:hypothetical protein P692DRAFT_20828921 [Suillus brevipes Sb2]